MQPLEWLLGKLLLLSIALRLTLGVPVIGGQGKFYISSVTSSTLRIPGEVYHLDNSYRLRGKFACLGHVNLTAKLIGSIELPQTFVVGVRFRSSDESGSPPVLFTVFPSSKTELRWRSSADATVVASAEICFPPYNSQKYNDTGLYAGALKKVFSSTVVAEEYEHSPRILSRAWNFVRNLIGRNLEVSDSEVPEETLGDSHGDEQVEHNFPTLFNFETVFPKVRYHMDFLFWSPPAEEADWHKFESKTFSIKWPSTSLKLVSNERAELLYDKSLTSYGESESCIFCLQPLYPQPRYTHRDDCRMLPLFSPINATGFLVEAGCGHVFHNNCLRQYLEFQEREGQLRGRRCPICTGNLY